MPQYTQLWRTEAIAFTRLFLDMGVAEIAPGDGTTANASQSDNGNGPTESAGWLRINIIGSPDTFKVEHDYISVSHS